MTHTYFVPRLLTGTLKRSEKSEIRRTIRDLLMRRRIPLHVANLWNALYYRWDIEAGGYPDINPARIEARKLGELDWSIPVGGFVKVGTDEKPIWTEVVFKEGRNKAIQLNDEELAWEIPPTLVGAQPGESSLYEGRQVHVLDELLVLDFNAFGMGELDEVLIQKLQRRGKRLDGWRHLPMRAAYELGEATLDDASFFAGNLIAKHRAGLLGEFLQREVSDDVMRAYLLTSLSAIRELAESAEGVLQWQNYFFLEEDFKRAKSDQSGDAKFGADMFSTVGRYIVSLPTTRRRFGPSASQGANHSVALALRDYAGHGGFDAQEIQELSGPSYGRLICWLNRAIRDRVMESKDRTVAVASDRFSVRLADPWLLGGIWYSEHVGPVKPSYSRLSPLIVLPLNRTGLPSAEAVRRELSASVDPPEPDVEFRRTKRRFSSAISMRAIDREELVLGNAIAEIAPGTAKVRLQISVEHEETVLLNEMVEIDWGQRILTNVPYEQDFYPGIKIVGWIEESGQVIRARVERLVQPRIIDGFTLAFAFDEDLYLAALRASRPLPPSDLKSASTLSDLIATVFRSRGTRTADGGYSLSLRDVSVGLYGPNADLESVRLVAAELESFERGMDAQYVWRPEITRQTNMTDGVVIRTFSETEAGQRLARAVKAHVVSMHLRRDPPADEVKWLVRAEEYRRALITTGAVHRLPPELPRHSTFVHQHERGGTREVAEEARNYSAKEPGADVVQLRLFA